MKSAIRISQLAIVCLSLAGSLCFSDDPKPAAPTTRPTTGPLALAKGPPADNSYCLTCHMNFNKEPVAANHRNNGVGCAKCHGDSDKHSSDENGIIPPDIIFAKQAVDAACMKCHDTASLQTKPKEHELVLNVALDKAKVCTDCHGQHVMATRTRRWDKITRKLISDDGVRMVQDRPEGK